jgi:hypothetical protein
MKSKYFFAVLAIIFSSVLISAQTSKPDYKITGAVSDASTNKPLIKASVLILSKASGKQLGGIATDEKGYFTIANIQESIVRVKVSMIGYQTKIIDSTDLNQSSRIGLVKLTPAFYTLPEVVIEEIKPVIEHHSDKQVINVDRLPGSSGTLAEALKNSGLVEVEPSTNKITVRGQSLKIQMDGRDYTMPEEMLSQLPASMIDQVEVILAPGAKESAEGGTYILNLITKKETFNNTSGMITLSPSTNQRTIGGAYLNYKAGNLNLFGQAYGAYMSSENTQESERYVYTSPIMYYQRTHGGGNSKYYYGYFKVGADYDFDDKNSVTFYVNYNGYKNKMDNLTTSDVINKENVFQYSYSSRSITDYGNNNLSLYGFYKRKFQEKGHELTLDVMYTSIDNPTDTKLNLNYSTRPTAPQLQNSNTDVTAKTVVVKLDYALPINKNKLEAGGSFSYRNRNNDYTSLNYSYQYATWLDSLNLSNHFNYKERITALYLSYSHIIDKFDFKLGLRGENLSSDGNQITQNLTFAENFLSFFPNLNIGYRFSDLFTVSVNAFRRVTYPQIYYINPFRRYSGPNSFSAGNPKLEPTYVNGVALNISQYASVFYNYTTGTITSAITTENDSTLISSYLNLNKEESYGFSLTLPYYNSPMMPIHLPDFITTCYLSFNYRYSKQTGQYLTEDLGITDKSITLNGYVGFKLWYDIDANASIYYIPKTTNRRMVRSETKYVSLYFSRYFFDQKIRCHISVNDLFNGQKGYSEMRGGSYYMRSSYEMLNSRGISIGLTYIFNKYKERRDRDLGDGRDSEGKGM